MTSKMQRSAIASHVLPVDMWTPEDLSADEEVDYIDIGSLDRDCKTVSSPSRISPRSAPSRARQIVHVGDVLVSTVRPNLNAVAMIPPRLHGAIASTGFCILRSDPNSLDARYLFYWARTPTFVAYLTRTATGASYPAVTDAIVQASRIPLPPLPEQRRIAAILDKADAIRRKRQEAIRLTDQFLRSAFLEMFGDPLVNPKAWPRAPIGDLFDEQRAGARCGPFGTALRKNDYVRHGVPVWGIDNVCPNRFVEEGSLFITPDKHAELTAYSVEPGDILISRAGTVGRMCVARPTSSPSIIGTNLIRVALDRQRIVPEYVTAIFTYFPTRVGGLRASSDESAYSFMKTSTLATLAVPLPPVTLQRKYEELVARHERMRSRQLELISESDVLFHSLVQRAFRGQL